MTDWLGEPCACGHLGDMHARKRFPELGRCLVSGCYCKEYRAW